MLDSDVPARMNNNMLRVAEKDDIGKFVKMLTTEPAFAENYNKLKELKIINSPYYKK
ncbi:MAG: hypothetical protein ACP5N2_06740 [Candidatus Nanoarchaeia archaeon]